MKKMKRILALLLTIILSGGMFGNVTAYASDDVDIDEEDTSLTVDHSGTFGAGVTWTEENGVLTFDGNGAMKSGTETTWSSDIHKVVIKGGITSVNATVLRWLPLTEYEVSENNRNYCSVNGTLYSKDRKVLVQYPAQKAGSTVVIPNGVTKIEDHAFQGNYQITKVVLPDSVITIGSQAFYDAEYLKEIDLGKGVQNIGDLAFAYSKLSEVTIPGSVQKMENSSFRYLSLLEKVTIEKGVKQIGESAFENDYNIKEVVLPSTIIEIGAYAFSGCNNLKSLTIPKSVIRIGNQAYGYLYDTIIEGVKIKGYGASEAINYAKRNGIPYVIIAKEVPAVKASNKTKTLGAGKFNLGVTCSVGPLSYKSGNTKIAKVDGKGNVTLVKNAVGSVTITVTSPATEEYQAVNKKITITVNPKGTAIKNVKALKGRKITTTWKKNASIDGYEIQYSMKKNFNSGVKKVLIKKNKTLMTNIEKLKKNKTYYMRIRTYKNVKGKKYYSTWSKVKSVNVK